MNAETPQATVAFPQYDGLTRPEFPLTLTAVRRDPFAIPLVVFGEQLRGFLDDMATQRFESGSHSDGVVIPGELMIPTDSGRTSPRNSRGNGKRGL